MKLSRLAVLSPEEVQRIHEDTLTVLAEVGLAVHSAEARTLLAQAGAKVDEAAERVWMPRELVEKAIASAPAQFTLLDRNKQPALQLGQGNFYAIAGHNATYVRDLQTGERRDGTKQDQADLARVADALKYIDAVSPSVAAQDVPKAAGLVHSCEAVLTNTTKHVYFSPGTAEEAEAVFVMARAIAGEDDLNAYPIITCQVSPVAPLGWEKGAVEALMACAKNGVPCDILPEPMAGVTAPVTLAGYVIEFNAEFVSGLVIAQLVRPGTPNICGVAATMFDMREGCAVIGTPEAALVRAMMSQMAQFYHVPCHCIGPDSDSHQHDAQASLEKTMNAIVAAASGADFMVNCGMFSTGLIISFEQLVIDNEIIAYVKRLLRGVEVNPETEAVDLIAKIGPGGQYLSQRHTLKYLKTEHQSPTIANRTMFGRWEERGGLDIQSRANAEARRILAEHAVPPLPDDVREKVRAAVVEFERQYA